MSNAFIVMPFKEPYEGIYVDVLRPSLLDAGFTVVRADEIQASSDINKDIVEGISKADLVVIEASERNPNVYFEFGLATSEGKELLIVAENGSDLPFDTRQWRHLFYDSTKPGDFSSNFSAWVERTAAYQKHHSRASAIRLNRGDVFLDIVDAALYTDTSDVEPVDSQIWRDVCSGALLPCWYSYYTDVGTESWLKLCQDPLYAVIRESVNMLSGNVDRILDALDNSFIESSPDFISLGPGNGQKDRLLLKGLVKRLLDRGIAPESYYYPIDISARMLSTASRTVKGDPDLASHLKIKVAGGDFEDIAAFRPLFEYRPAPNLFSFLGNTLGNVSDEINLLNRIRNAMRPHDVLLLELRLLTGNLELRGDHFGLSFAPLQRLGVSYDPSKIQVRQLGSLSQIPKTQTTSVHYVNTEIRGQSIPDVTLSCVNFYDRDSTREVLEAAPLGFSVLDVIDSRGLVTYVLRNG